MRGRKPKPTEVTKLHGSPGKRRMNDAEPIPPGALDEPPGWLTAEQAASWRYALANAPPGLLRRLDRGVLTIWVVAEGLHQRAARLLEQYSGEDLLTTQGDQKIPSPYLSILNKQALIMFKAASELGFSPVARVRAYAQPGGGFAASPKQRSDGSNIIPLAQYVANAPPRPTR
jgi:phage terminase small subunit